MKKYGLNRILAYCLFALLTSMLTMEAAAYPQSAENAIKAQPHTEMDMATAVMLTDLRTVLDIKAVALTNASAPKQYTSDEILSALFHMDILEEYDITPNCRSERNKIFSKIKKALSKSPLYAKTEKGGLFKADYIAITNGASGAEYFYYGDVKKNRPSGFGVLCTGIVSLEDLSTLPALCYAGAFKEGRTNGYGACFLNNAKQTDYERNLEALNRENVANAELMAAYYMAYVIYDGYFANNRMNGKGNEFSVGLSVHKEGLSLTTVIAEWKKGAYSGRLKSYYDDMPGFDGHMKHGAENGTGTRYYDNGQIAYTGEWKNGKYHGKGTLYDRDGNVIYKGKWKNGDYAS